MTRRAQALCQALGMLDLKAPGNRLAQLKRLLHQATESVKDKNVRHSRRVRACTH